MKVCLYTALFGDHTDLKPPLVGLDGTSGRSGSNKLSLVCFSDRALASSDWDVRVKPATFFEPRLNGKWYRMMPHIELQKFDVTIWVDSTFQIGDVRAFASWCLGSLRSRDASAPDYGSALFVDPECTDIYNEAEYSIAHWPNKYPAELVRAQVASYRAEGLPAVHSMYAGGIHVRDNRVAWVQRLNVLWLAECLRWSPQDQLSLPYVLWKLGRSSAIIPGYLYEGPHWKWIMAPRDHVALNSRPVESLPKNVQPRPKAPA